MAEETKEQVQNEPENQAEPEKKEEISPVSDEEKTLYIEAFFLCSFNFSVF